jgi:DmsE family decaheme c-type cytochrome
MANRTSFHYVVPFLTTCVLLGALFLLPDGARSAPEYARVSRACLECHDGKDASLAATAHALPAGAPDGAEARVACTDCHAGDPRHWEEDAEKYPMTNPSKVDAKTEVRVCSACHQNAHQQNMVEKNGHTNANVNCSGCHSVHGSTHPSLLMKTEPELCLGCHTGVEGQFAKPYRHPVMEGVLKCSECHMTLSETRRELSHNGTNVCMRCHAEFEGPFPHEHQATVDYSTEEGGCISCHEPHGSYLPRMLRQPYEGPHFQLCTQCHSVPRHNANTMHGTTWSGKPCNDCHTDIHGSYSNRLFMSESLLDAGCFNAGCHHL